jgi:hypothetical protein
MVFHKSGAMMLIYSIAFLGVFATSHAFVVGPLQATPSSSSALFSRPDSSAAVADALRISQEFGASSDEAKVAWETVEEMDSSDIAPALGQTTQLSVEDANKMDYAMQVSALSYLLKDTQDKIAQIKVLASNIKQLELEDGSLTKLPPDSASLKTALAEAKAAKEVHGASSPEAIKAWEAVEDCADSINGADECNIESMYRYSAAALKAHHYYDAVIDSAFLQTAINALDIVDSLRRFIQIENNRLNGAV